MNKYGRDKFSIDIDYRLIIVLALAVCVMFLSLNYTRCIIEGQSMNNTFIGKEKNSEEYKDTVVLSGYLGKLKPGDIITFTLTHDQQALLPAYGTDEEAMLIKRIIAVPGEEIKFVRQSDNGINYIALYKFDKKDGLWKEIIEDYIKDKMQHSGDFNAAKIGDVYEVEENCYFVMGDNRNNSSDSRVFGQITRSQINGKVIGKGGSMVWMGEHFEQIKLFSLIFLGFLTILALDAPRSEKANRFERMLNN